MPVTQRLLSRAARKSARHPRRYLLTSVAVRVLSRTPTVLLLLHGSPPSLRTVLSLVHLVASLSPFVQRQPPPSPTPDSVKAESAPSPTLGPAKKRRRKEKAPAGAKEQPFSSIRVQIAAWAAKVVAAPEANVGILKEIREFSAAHRGRAAALSILTEAQLFKDIAPAYRIRSISETEAAVSVSKEVAKLRSFEQALLAAYRRFIKSVVALSRWRSGTSKAQPTTKATDQMMRVRRASCTALCELLRATPPL